MVNKNIVDKSQKKMSKISPDVADDNAAIALKDSSNDFSVMLSPNQVSQYLTEFYHRHLPISDYLGLRLHDYTGDVLSLAIDLNPSINDKLTAFGGSLFSLCVLNCWGMVYLQARQRGFNPNLVVSRANIEFLAPVDDSLIVATCTSAADMDWQSMFDSFASKGRAKATLSSNIVCAGKEAVRFQGQYTIIGINN